MKLDSKDEDLIYWSKKCTKNFYEKQNRPSWDEYFLQLAFFVSLRSDDKFIRHGAVLVDNNTHHIIGTGYNGTFAGCNIKEIESENRDKRRKWMIHAEENLIANSTKTPKECKNGATIYITGEPCVNCLQRIINFGVDRIVYQNTLGTITENEETKIFREQILSMNPNLKIEQINTDWLL